MFNSPEVVVVLAAGFGSRLKSEDGVVKPLRSIAGRPLILRVLERFRECGVKEAVVVLGYRGDDIRRGIESESPSMDINFVYNPRYEKSNGLSVLAAKEAVADRHFFLSMSDHIFGESLVTGLAEAPVPEGGLVLAVDRKLDDIFDMDDATKVRTEEGRIVEIHKNLKKFDSVDTGLFACSPALFHVLEAAAAGREDRDCTLSDGVTFLAAKGLARVHDIGSGTWQDVDTPGAAQHAEKLFGTP